MTENEEFAESFKLFNINGIRAPLSTGPEEYSVRIKKCTLLTYGEISYSNNTSNFLLANAAKGNGSC
jgi:hypothetical protein